MGCRLLLTTLTTLTLLVAAVSGGDLNVGFRHQGAKIMFETFLDGPNVRCKLVTAQGTNFDALLQFAGGPSVVAGLATDDTALVDTFLRYVYPLMDLTAAALASTGGANVFDARFLFGATNNVLWLAFDSMSFLSPTAAALKDLQWFQCLPREGTGLCTLAADDGLPVTFFGATGLCNEERTEITVDGAVLMLPSTWATTPAPACAVPVGTLLMERDLVYDIARHRLALPRRHPSRSLKAAAASMAVILTFVFFARLLVPVLGTHLFWHMLFEGLAIAGVTVALVTQTRAFRRPAVLYATVGVTVGYIVVDAFCQITERWLVGVAFFDRERTHFRCLDMKADIALIWLALVLDIYAITSFSMMIIPTLLVMASTARVISDVVSALMGHCVPGLRMGIVFPLLLVLHLFVAVVTWRYIISEFLDTSAEGVWYLQINFISLLVLVGGLTMASVKHGVAFASTVPPIPAPQSK